MILTKCIDDFREMPHAKRGLLFSNPPQEQKMPENRTCYVSPGTPYARLMEALNLPYEEYKHLRNTYTLSQVLDVRQSLLSDAIRRQGILLFQVIDAAADKGISREYLLTGQLPMYLPGWKRGPGSPSLPIKEDTPELGE